MATQNLNLKKCQSRLYLMFKWTQMNECSEGMIFINMTDIVAMPRMLSAS